MFFKSLFDFKFENFVTRQVTSVLYAISVVLVLLASVLGMMLALIMLGNSGGILNSPIGLVYVVAIFAIPVVAFIYIVLIRVALEASIALIAIAENTKRQSN